MSDSISNPDFESVEDYRYDPFTDTENPKNIGLLGEPPEYRRIPSNSPYWLKLFFIPVDDNPSTLEVWKIGSPDVELTQVAETVTPAIGEFRCNYEYGLLDFNANEAGIDIYINYKGRGSSNMRLLLDTIQDEIIAFNMIFGSKVSF